MPKEGGIFFYSQSQDFNPLPALASLSARSASQYRATSGFAYSYFDIAAPFAKTLFFGTPVFRTPWALITCAWSVFAASGLLWVELNWTGDIQGFGFVLYGGFLEHVLGDCSPCFLFSRELKLRTKTAVGFFRMSMASCSILRYLCMLLDFSR